MNCGVLKSIRRTQEPADFFHQQGGEASRPFAVQVDTVLKELGMF